MTIGCEKVQELLGKYYDKELHGPEHAAVTEHLQSCIHCSNDLEKLERVGGILRHHFEEISASQTFSGMWDRILSDIAAAKPEPVPLWKRFTAVLVLPKPVWATIGAVAVAVVLLLSYLPGQRSAIAANDCIIDKVEADDHTVMVYETDQTKMKIIWVIDQHNGAEPEEGAFS